MKSLIYILFGVILRVLLGAWTTPKTWTSEPLLSTDYNTYIRDNQNYLKDRADGTSAADQYIRTATDYSTSSASLVDVDASNLALTITTTGGDVLVTFAGYGTITGGTVRDMVLAVEVDSTAYEIVIQENYANSGQNNMSFSYLFTGLSADSHTFTLQWRMTSGGTGNLIAGTLLFDVRETMGRAS